MSKPESSWPFQSLWSRACLAGAALGFSGALLAGGMVFYGLFTRVPGGDQALATAPLHAGDGWQSVMEFSLEAGDRVDFWEIQDPPAEGSPRDYSVVVRLPSGKDQAPRRQGTSHISVGGIRAEGAGSVEAQESGVHVVEAQVRALPRGHEITLAAHAEGTVGPGWHWVGALFACGLLAGLSGLGCGMELARWLMERISAD